MRAVSPEQTFAQHLLELRTRFLFILLSLLLGTLIGYFLHESLISILIKPLNQPLFYTSPTGGLDFVIKVSLLFGIIISTPIFIYQIIKFTSPLLPNFSNQKISLFLVASCFLTLMGAGFAYYISLPALLNFLTNFSSSQINSLMTVNEYFSFIIRYILGFGILFQLPLLMIFINSIHKLETRNLLKAQRYVIVLSFLIAAVITPTPDIFNQLIMALPLVALYQFSVLLIWLINRNGKISSNNI